MLDREELDSATFDGDVFVCLGAPGGSFGVADVGAVFDTGLLNEGLASDEAGALISFASLRTALPSPSGRSLALMLRAAVEGNRPLVSAKIWRL